MYSALMFMKFQVKDAMESYIIRREEHTTDKPFYTLKEDLLVMAKQKAFEMGANAIIQAKLSISRGNNVMVFAYMIQNSSFYYQKPISVLVIILF